MPPVIFATQSYVSRSLPISAQRCVNTFFEQQPESAKSQATLFGTSGLTPFSTCGAGPVRGLWRMNQDLYAVSGGDFYIVGSDGTSTVLGTGITGSRPVSMTDNGTQIVVVQGTGGWIYDAPGGLRPIVDPAFYPADTVTFFDNVFVFNRTGTNQWFISGILDGETYNGLDFASAEASGKNLLGIAQNLQLLFLFSEDHIEVWYDAGSLDFPFQRYSGGVVWRGCKASLSIINHDKAIFFLGDDLVFYKFQGSDPVPVSTYGINKIIQDDPDPSQAFCFSHNIEGHKFVYLTLPASNRTVGYDSVTNRWHERESWNSSNISLGRWRANCSCEAYGRSFVGDVFDGVISSLDLGVYTERGNTMRSLIHSNPFHSDKKRIFFPRLELDMEMGVGLTTGQGSDPQAMLRVSKDGGRSWSLIQPTRSLGRIGDFTKRLRYLALGQAYDWVFELSITDPVKRVFIAAHADIIPGM